MGVDNHLLPAKNGSNIGMDGSSLMPHEGISDQMDEIEEKQEDNIRAARNEDVVQRLARAHAMSMADEVASKRVERLVYELWHTGMALSVIAHWRVMSIPFISHFNHGYIVAWILRTANLLVSCGRADLAADMVTARDGRKTVEVPILAQARSIILNNQDDPSYIRKRLSELEITS